MYQEWPIWSRVDRELIQVKLLLKKGRLTYLITILLALSCFMPVHSASPKKTTIAVESASLPKIQAAYIYNLMKFTIWPQTAFKDKSNIRVGFVGNDPVTQVLEKQLVNRKAQDRNIIVESLSPTSKSFVSSSGKPFHILYICEGVFSKNEINSIESQETLLVGSYENFTKEGGMVSVIYDTNKDKVIFHVNLKAMSRKTLSLSSKLLKIATIDE